MKKQLFLIHGSALLAMFFWGMSYIWMKQVFVHIGPATTILIRLLISSVFLFILLKLMRKTERIYKKDVGIIFLAALLNPFLYFIGESFGLQLVSPTISAAIIATIPVFTPVFAYIFLREKLSWLSIAGLIISFAGILVMLVLKDLTFSASPDGIPLLFGAVASAVFYGLLLKKLTLRYKPLTIVWLQNSIGILYFLPVVLLKEGKEISDIQLTFPIIQNLILLGIFASSLAFVFFTYTVSKIGISRTNIYTNMIPVFAAFFSYYILNELITSEKIVGIALVITGVILSQKRKKKIPLLFKTHESI
ncbi:MAG: EamA family transporter [Bacteroidetes bacterium HGW-Bacteroidetes-1]|nr:MAG: EamA family transporter [Bacteroidetes bacterium HGW-Bacteroidetes-1]